MLWIARVNLAVLLTCAASASAYCPNKADYSIAGEFRRSEYVALVHVGNVTWLDENRRPTRLKPPLTFGSIPGGLDPYVGAYYRVKALEVFKGKVPGQFKIFSENTTARTPMSVGRDYLVFLTRAASSDDYVRKGDFTGDACGNWGPASTRSKELSRVRKLSRER